jgi:DNA-binding response OmpR family regulator
MSEGNPMESRTFDGIGNGSTITDFADQASRRRGRRKLVLIVDDQEPLRVMMGWFLRKNGFRVLLAGTSDAALRIFERFSRPIDLLITDIQLPKSSGFDLAEAFASARPTLPVLFISGALTEEDPEVRRRISPGRDFLAKPFSPKVLETKVGDMLAVSNDVRGVAGPAPFRWSAFEAC